MAPRRATPTVDAMTGLGFRKIVVGYDSTEPAQDALRLAALLADATGAHLIVAAVENDLNAGLAHHLADARERLPYGSRAELIPLRGRSVAQALTGFAEEEGADLVVLGASHRGERVLSTLGGVADRLIHGAPCAVAVAPPGFRMETDPGLRVIGVAYDGSPESERALAAAEGIGLAAGATLRIIGVLEPVNVSAGMSAFYGYGEPARIGRDALYEQLDEAVMSVAEELRPLPMPATGDPAEEIVKRAGVLDLLVTGSRAHGPLRRVLLGSVSAGLVHAAPCPVLVLPRGAALDATAAEAA